MSSVAGVVRAGVQLEAVFQLAAPFTFQVYVVAAWATGARPVAKRTAANRRGELRRTTTGKECTAPPFRVDNENHSRRETKLGIRGRRTLNGNPVGPTHD